MMKRSVKKAMNEENNQMDQMSLQEAKSKSTH
jgi:hypothetical protein